MKGQIQHQVPPVYPPPARQARIQGTVTLDVVIRQDGTIGDISLISGHPMLAPAAIEAVRQWTYKPYTIDGRATEVETQIQVNFSLSGHPAPAADVVSEAPQRDSDCALLIKWTMPEPPDPSGQSTPGRILIRTIVSETGTVVDAVVINGDAVMGQTLVSAVREWNFQPFIKAGKAVPVTTIMTFWPGPHSTQPEENQRSPEMYGTGGGYMAPFRVRVPPGIVLGLLQTQVQPVYPPEAREAGIQGKVLLRARISKTGEVTDLERMSGPTELYAAAATAVRQWRYRPFIFMGEAADIETLIQTNFAPKR